MKKILLTLVLVLMLTVPAIAATWVAADRVATVGKTIVSKNSLPAAIKYQVVNGAVDNSMSSTNNIIQVSSTDLTYAGNDNEVAAVVATEIGQIINGKSTKDKMRNAAKAALAEKLSATNILNTAVNSEYAANKAKLDDLKLADLNGVDLMVKSGYNPLAMVVVITKMPGSNIEIALGKPSNSERAMNVYNYISYTYPEQIKKGYNCQEYRNFLSYAEPIVAKREKSKSALKKFNKAQEKLKTQRARALSQYQMSGGKSSWDATYAILNEITTTKNK